MMRFFDSIFPLFFRMHDAAFSLVAKYAGTLKATLLLVAHASLFGIFFPELRREFGSLAGNLLIVILFLSPAAAMTSMPFLRLVMGFRRELGILMAYLAIVHAAGHFLDPVFFGYFIEPYLGSSFFDMDTKLLLGILAIILIFPLLLTSNSFMFRKLGGRNWKRIHFLAYPMFVTVVAHQFFVSGTEMMETLVRGAEAIALVGTYTVLKYMTWKKNSFSFIRNAVNIIAERYGIWKDQRLKTL